jgi:Cu+-exporting ATPase
MRRRRGGSDAGRDVERDPPAIGRGYGASAVYPNAVSRETAPDLKGDPAMAKDPVCGMNVDEKTAAATVVHKGTTHYFCSAGCKAKFEKAPAQYLKS